MSRPLEMERVTRAMLSVGPEPERSRRAPRPRWTPEETAFLAQHFRRRGAVWCAKQLGRSREAVTRHANAHGVFRQLWTQAEVTTLRAEWGAVGIRSLRRKLGGRTWKSIEFKARRLGLDGPNQGLVSMSEASEITGVNVTRLRRILAEEGVPVRRRLSTFHGKVQGLYHHTVVDPTDASDAVVRWLRRQATRMTLGEAVERYKVSGHVLRAALRRLAAIRPVQGLSPAAWSVAPADVEAALAQHRDRTRCWRVPARCAGGLCARRPGRAA